MRARYVEKHKISVTYTKYNVLPPFLQVKTTGNYSKNSHFTGIRAQHTHTQFAFCVYAYNKVFLSHSLSIPTNPESISLDSLSDQIFISFIQCSISWCWIR